MLTVRQEILPDKYLFHIERDSIEPIVFQIKKSKKMFEVNLALRPLVFKTTVGNNLIIQDKFFDLDHRIYFRNGFEHLKQEFDEATFNRICMSSLCHDAYQKDVTDVFECTLQQLTFDKIKEKWNEIPIGSDVQLWKVLPINKVILYDRIWHDLPMVLNGTKSLKAYAYTLSKFFRVNTEFAENHAKRELVSRKVVLPFANPKLLKHNYMVLTSTPQSSKAGKIAEIPIGSSFDEFGYSSVQPIRSIGYTSAQCPFPQRMKPTREVVLRSLSQAMDLKTRDVPMVINNI